MDFNKFGRQTGFAVIGLGARSIEQLDALLAMEDVKIHAVCDVYQDRIESTQKRCVEKVGYEPQGFTDYQEALKLKEVEGVFIFTDWNSHIRIAIDCMNAGKRPAMEVGGASSIDECWRLVRKSQETNIPVMLLENCCYDTKEYTVLQLVRKGFFGELIHCEGGYKHYLCDEIGEGDVIRHYRQDHFHHRNAELYPTHEIGPIATYLNFNYGNRPLTLTSMASKARGLQDYYDSNRPDSKWRSAPIQQGDIVTTCIKCANGETVMIQHDCTLPRPYSRGGVVRGTKAMWSEDTKGICELGSHKYSSDAELFEKEKPQLLVEYDAFGRRGGHGGMDYLVLRAFVESVQNNTYPPIDVYDAALWMSLTVLSEQSIAMGSMPVPIPDFTDGEWIKRKALYKGAFALFEDAK